MAGGCNGMLPVSMGYGYEVGRFGRWIYLALSRVEQPQDQIELNERQMTFANVSSCRRLLY